MIAWWFMPVKPQRARQEDFRFDASLGYIECSRQIWATY
jgi:hypothetical protein